MTLKKIAEFYAKLIERRDEERFVEHGTTEGDTNASYYTDDWHTAQSEEDENCAQAILTATLPPELVAEIERMQKDAERAMELERDLLEATAIGISTILARCGVYSELSPYLKDKWDRLQALHMKCGRAFNENAAIAGKEAGT